MVLFALGKGWSPEQIAGRLAQKNGSVVISYETIYRFIYAQIARTKDYSWRHYLPRAKSKRGFRGRKGRSLALNIKGRRSIHERPEPTGAGHHEADLILFSTYGQAILVTLEKESRAITVTNLANKRATYVAGKIRKNIMKLPKPLRKTLTVDNGTEFAKHTKNGLPTYFCDTHSPWQKGGVENANGRLRRWLPRKTNLDLVS